MEQLFKQSCCWRNCEVHFLMSKLFAFFEVDNIDDLNFSICKILQALKLLINAFLGALFCPLRWQYCIFCTDFSKLFRVKLVQTEISKLYLIPAKFKIIASMSKTHRALHKNNRTNAVDLSMSIFFYSLVYSLLIQFKKEKH